MPEVIFKIKCSNQGEKVHQIALDDETSVQAAKDSIVALADIPAANQRWIYKGKVLDSSSSLKSCNISQNDTVLVFKSPTALSQQAPTPSTSSTTAAAPTSNLTSTSSSTSASAASVANSTSATSTTVPNAMGSHTSTTTSITASTTMIQSVPLFDAGMNKLLANSGLEICKSVTSTLLKVVSNIINNPSEEKYRKIKKSNEVFAKKVTNIPGGVDTLIGLGFSNEPEEYAMYPSAEAWNSLVSCKIKLENFAKKLESMPASSFQDGGSSSNSSSNSSSGGGSGGSCGSGAAPSVDATQIIFQHILSMTNDSQGSRNPTAAHNTTAKAEFDWAAIFGDTIQSKGGVSISTNTALRGKTVAIYFSASWCPPCKQFTPLFSSYYQQKRHAGEQIEVVFVSSDRDSASFASYFDEMPWLALPFARRDLHRALSAKYGVSGIPTLIFLNPDGSISTTDGRSKVMRGI